MTKVKRKKRIEVREIHIKRCYNLLVNELVIYIFRQKQRKQENKNWYWWYRSTGEGDSTTTTTTAAAATASHSNAEPGDCVCAAAASELIFMSAVSNGICISLFFSGLKRDGHSGERSKQNGPDRKKPERRVEINMVPIAVTGKPLVDTAGCRTTHLGLRVLNLNNIFLYFIYVYSICYDIDGTIQRRC